MIIVPVHQWKVPLKYWAMLLFRSGPLGLGGAADTMVWGGVPTKWWEQKSTSTYILKLRRNSTREPYFVTEASSHRHSTATAVAAARHSPLATRHSPLATRHSPPLQPRWLRGFSFIVIVIVVIVIITAVTTVSPPSSVIYLIVVFVLSLCPLPFLIRGWPSRPPHLPSSLLTSSSLSSSSSSWLL